MKRRALLSAFILPLLLPCTLRAQYSQHSPEFISRSNPGKIVRDFHDFYMDGRCMQPYEMYSVLPLEDYMSYRRNRSLCIASSWTAFAGVVSAFAGATVLALNAPKQDRGTATAGKVIAACGIATVAVSITVDLRAQKKLRKVATDYNLSLPPPRR